MGYFMASNLLKKATPASFMVHDVNTAAVDRFLDEHPTASRAASPAQLAEKCRVILTMLPESAHVAHVYLDEATGLAGRVAKDAVVIDSSTIDPSTSKQVAQAVSSRGAHALDAPVSGGISFDKTKRFRCTLSDGA